MKNKSILLFLFLGLLVQAQEKLMIDNREVVRIETELASDGMEGRATFTPGIELASAFIEKEFKNIDLSYFGNLTNYRQEFDVKGKPANNVIGILPGKSKPDEYVIFSAHYDHLGMVKEGADRIYNGANDDASGTTAVIALAKYFKELNQNERTIIFVAFTAEEIGGFGSKFFSEKMDPAKVVAMFNIEMIGTESKWGKNSAYITGFEKTDFGTILQKNLEATDFNFYADPYPKEQLFYRSDNARLAAQGVPAHTISTSKMDVEANYHKLSDEVSTLDLDNMTEIITAIAISSQTIISGQDTPSRVKK
ncbi:M20/M25/M40 family metallo-hydrolase [Flavobacterium granuli]|uniref:Peptidase M28-like protein n=1 Tax=Flavobacterium granuli TaxID=280093 RepID=A0A1M5PQE6_9FLAO|nr:M20/M25/M40 family metallo-hydrolase [Flavobacterium granuli]PRZ26577.1 peptidase M28-like protein [Flavobacterium granuli]SHH03932.1 Peptidase family M28 [Flavobacterium granuli]